MVSARFRLPGPDAEAALATGLDSAADQFVNAVNKVIDAHLPLASPERPLLFFAIDRSSVEYFYLVVRGGEGAPPAVGRIALSSYRVAKVPGAHTADEHEAFQRYISESLDTHLAHRFLAAGRSSLESGLLEVSLLQLVIAAEIATSRAIDTLLSLRGGSKTKRERHSHDLTYSVCLNVLLVSLAPETAKPPSDLLGTLNWGRDARNDLMHNGIFSVSRDRLRELCAATARYLDYLVGIAGPTRAT